MQSKKLWEIKDSHISEELMSFCKNNKILAKLLANRGINTATDAERFLNPLRFEYSNPDIFTDMHKAVCRIKSAIDNKQRITVYGDFDADGVTSTALLYLTLKHLGADVDYYLPNRVTESHGLNSAALVNIIKKSKLIITVDCGISNVKEVNFAKSFGADIIITDHHEAPETLPDAFAVINPKAQGSLDENLDIQTIQNMSYLAGVGVAFKLACKLSETYKSEDFVNEILPLAAVGTIGDIVELKGENRSIAAAGIELLKNGKQKGLLKLAKTPGTKNEPEITSETITYTIVPKLNAAGRLESANTAIKLLISDNDADISKYTEELNKLNNERQQKCEETYAEAKSLYEQDNKQNKNAIILLNDNWHIGIIGIVASKLVEEFDKPVFLMTRDTKSSNIIRCSCRSISDINIHEVLSVHKDLFEGFGGHKMAAGFSFDEDKIKFDEFKRILTATINEYSLNTEHHMQLITADCELSPEEISVETADFITKLEPFGAENPQPCFIIKNATVKEIKMTGKNENHLKLMISKDNSQYLECLKWNSPNIKLKEASKIDLLFTLKKNTFNGITKPQLMISDFHIQNKFKLIDHRNKKDIFNQVTDFLEKTKKITGIYVTDAEIREKLSFIDKITLFSEENIPENIEQLMFFDIPYSEESLKNILKKTAPDIIHIMNFNQHDISCEKIMVKIPGMIKYVLNNKNGEFDVPSAANALYVTKDAVETALELLKSENIINYTNQNGSKKTILFLNPAELSKLKSNELYYQLTDIADEINKFKEYWLESDSEELEELMRTLI